MKTNLRAYEIFLAVADANSMTGAAKRLDISQAAVSQQIAGLEKALGVKLIERSTREIRFTPVGISLRYAVRKVFEELMDLEQSIKRFSGFIMPSIKVAIMDALSEVLAPTLMGELNPFVECIEIRSGGFTDHREGILAGKLDIIISSDPPKSPDIRVFPLVTDPLMLITPRGFFDNGNLDLEVAASSLPMARLIKRRLMAKTVDRFLARRAILVPRAYEFDHDRLMLDSVRRGEAWTINSAFSLLNAGKSAEDFDVYALPASAPVRTIALAAREVLPSDLTQKLSESCRHVLTVVLAQKLRPIAPRVMDSVKIIQ